MWSWLRRLFADPPQPAAEPPPVAALPPPAGPPPPPQELVDTLDAVRKAARAQAKLALRLDELHEITASQITALREGIDAATAKTPATLPWAELLDALDLLEHAADELAASDRDDVAQGLRRVAGRVGRFVEKGGYQRLGAVGEPVDPRRFRVVGTDDVPASEEGTIVRVLRAAVVQEGRVVREGEVITQRKRPS